MKIEAFSMQKEFKLHYNNTYAKGVTIDDSLISLQERLEMSPDFIWKIFKVPNSKKVILTFWDANVPNYLGENIRTGMTLQTQT